MFNNSPVKNTRTLKIEEIKQIEIKNNLKYTKVNLEFAKESQGE